MHRCEDVLSRNIASLQNLPIDMCYSAFLVSPAAARPFDQHFGKPIMQDNSRTSDLSGRLIDDRQQSP
jgi:hypothetical protein